MGFEGMLKPMGPIIPSVGKGLGGEVSMVSFNDVLDAIENRADMLRGGNALEERRSNRRRNTS